MTIGGRTVCACVVSMLVSGSAAPVVAQTIRASNDTENKTVDSSSSSNGYFGSFLGSSFGDFKRLPSTDTAKWLGIGTAIALLGHSVDRPVSSGMSTRALEEPFESGDTLGGFKLQLGGALATYSVGYFTGNSRVASVGSDLLRAQIITKTLTVGLKTAAQRTRPDGTPFSFPSGHTSASFATATVLQSHFGWKVGVPAYALATYVGASRLQAQKHFLSDVAFGAAIGIVAGRTVTMGVGEHRLAVSPMATPGGAGISFSLVNPN